MTETYEGTIAVPLTKEDKSKAFDNGYAIWHYQRVERNTQQNSVHAVTQYKETGPVFEAKSQAAEIAVAKHLGMEDLYIGFQTEGYTKPDLGFVEVRRTLQVATPLTVWTKDVRAGALVVRTYYEDSIIYITGWEWASVAWDNGDYFKRDARIRARLQPASTLKATVEAHKAGVAA